jgi:hypothetical protein
MTTYRSLRNRVILAAGLAVCAVLLYAADFMFTPESDSSRAVELRPALQEINAVVDTLLLRYHIAKGWVKTWQVQTAQKKFLRVERRVFVPPDFISVNFNHDLARMVADYGATAVATERTKENSVTMHIKKDNSIIQSISFVTKRDLR